MKGIDNLSRQFTNARVELKCPAEFGAICHGKQNSHIASTMGLMGQSISCCSFFCLFQGHTEAVVKEQSVLPGIVTSSQVEVCYLSKQTGDIQLCCTALEMKEKETFCRHSVFLVPNIRTSNLRDLIHPGYKPDRKLWINLGHPGISIVRRNRTFGLLTSSCT